MEERKKERKKEGKKERKKRKGKKEKIIGTFLQIFALNSTRLT